MAKRAYFSDFPTVEYNGVTVRNIILKPKIKDSVFGNEKNFYPYVIKDDLRPDQVAAFYYGNAEYMWLIFLANDIVDPYYQWPMTNSALNKFIADKYGSLPAAKAKILHYKHKTKNYIITKETYDSSSSHHGQVVTSQFSPVYAYNFEEDKNEAKREIQLIDRALASTAFDRLREAMIEND